MFGEIMLRDIEELTTIHTWHTEVEYKRWLVIEYLSSQPYGSRLKFILTLIKNYFYFFNKTQKVEKGNALPHSKFIRTILKEFVHCRWINFNDDSKSDQLCTLKIISELCCLFNNISEDIIAYSVINFMFTLDKNIEKSAPHCENEKRLEFDTIIVAAISYPCPLLLESAAFFILNNSNAFRVPIDFRTGSSIFYDLCNIIPNGVDTLFLLPKTAPNFFHFIFFCVCRKLANKLRSIVPPRCYQPSSYKIDGCPSYSVICAISSSLKNNPNLISMNKPPLIISLPDVNQGDLRQCIVHSPSPLDDLYYLSIGYSLWLSSINKSKEYEKIETAFEELHAIFVDHLSNLEAPETCESSTKIEEEEEEGEIELGELVEDGESNLDQLETSSPQIKLANFVLRASEIAILKKEQLDETTDRFSHVLMAMYKGNNSISSKDIESLSIFCQKLPQRDLLDQVLTFMSTSNKTNK